MKEKVLNGKGLAVLSVFVLMIIAMCAAPVRAGAEETQALVTEYANLWTSTDIAVKVGVPVKWYVTVPEDTEPKGCGATVKIPGLGFGTDTHNKEEGHIVLQKGENFIYEFTPTETGDILFTCWMGSGCHYNYIHVTEDGTYSVPKPADPTEISAVREGDKATVSFRAPEAPEGSSIVGYTVTATAEDGTRKKTTVAESPATLEGLDESKEYTIVVVTKGTSGKSAGENKFILEAVNPAADASEEETEKKDESNDDRSSGQDGDNTSDNKNETESASGTAAGKPSESSGTADARKDQEEQVIVTEYSELWTGNITVKVGVPVKWYVNVPEGTALNGCAKTIKIPGLGWGTDTHNKEEGHLTLETGKNFVYGFTPKETGDILFTCWMGSGCHHNYIHVTADGKPDPDAKTGGASEGQTHHDDVSAADTDKHTDHDSKADSGSGDGSADKTNSATNAKPAPVVSSAANTGGAQSDLGIKSSAEIAPSTQTVSASPTPDTKTDKAGAAVPQSASADPVGSDNPRTGGSRVREAGGTVLLMLLTASAAAAMIRKRNDE
ncbi:MAG: fibronectin type III domain-containing protein [Ruminococcus sp.]|nr:fibronectin type III domain-containing protein [Ruminococcus sp.]